MKTTFKTFNTSFQKLDQAISNVLGQKVAEALSGASAGGRISAHKIAIVDAFVKGSGSADDHYHLRAAMAVLNTWGWYETGESKE